MIASTRFSHFLSAVLTMMAAAPLIAEAGPAEEGPTTFERIFGVPGTLDASMVKRVKALPPGEQLQVDTDHDGTHDETWFIDTATRHTAARRPVLVRVIDEDGDLDACGPDLDSDLYLADWRADGVIDGVIDYQDNDADGDLDEMGIYFGDYQQPWTDKNQVKVWWSRDVGDDNRLWYDTDWNYDQVSCQYRSHFSGDEIFYQFELKGRESEWLNVFEDPFAFYDPDQDGCSEAVVRICAVGHEVISLRYSIDADNDAYGRHTHDYDCSVTALPNKQRPIQIGDQISETFNLRGIPVHPVLRWRDARQFARDAPWDRALFIWDEMNANTAAATAHDPHERWEGIINPAADSFPRVGGPACSTLNKRFELADQPGKPLQLYFDRTDRRLHFVGASKGWIEVDADLDGTTDARYDYQDDNGDGIFDRRRLDLDADGQVDFEWKMQGSDVKKFSLEYASIQPFYQQLLDETLRESQAFIDQAKAALDWPEPDQAESFFLTRLDSWMPETRLGHWMRTTPAGARYYLDLIRDRLLLALSRRFEGHPRWNALLTAYQAGNYRQAAEILADQIEVPGRKTVSPDLFRSYRRRIAIEIDNRRRPQRDDWPVVLSVRDLQQMAPGLTTGSLAIVPSARWIERRQIPHQVDMLDSAEGLEVSFLAQLPGDSVATWYLYYDPATQEEVVQGQTTFSNRTGAAQDWIPPNIGWESDRGAYRAYWGQFDFFGKNNNQLIYDTIGSQRYHQELEWGIDALHVGKTSGLGGLTLLRGDRAWPVRNPAGAGNVHFTKQILTAGPIRAAIAFTANHIVPDEPEQEVQVQCIIYAGHQESEIRAELTGTGLLAPGIVHLPRETTFQDPKTGCFGSWGWQEDAIGQIGMGVIVPPESIARIDDLPEERRIGCRTSESGQLRYWIIGDWRRGRQYPVGPTATNWQQELQSLSLLLLNDVRITLGQPEEIQ